MLRDVMEVVVFVGMFGFAVLFAISQHKGSESLKRNRERREAARKEAEARKRQG